MKRVMGAATALAVGLGVFATGAAAQAVRGITDKEIIIGMHTDLSGPASFFGVSSRNAAQMRYDTVNAAGGINGRKIKFVVEDTQYQVPRGVAAANKLINRDHVFAIVGALGTPIVNATFKELAAANVPNLFPLSSGRSMSEPLSKLKFVLGATYYDQMRSGIHYLWKEKQRKTLCVFYEDTDFGQEIVDAANDQAKVIGTTIKETAAVKPTDTDFSAALTKLKNANCDLVAMGTIIKTSIIPVGAAKRMGWNDVVFTGTTASYDYVVAAAPGGATEGFYSASGNFLPYLDTASPDVKEWMTAYKEKFKADINSGSLYGWAGADLTVTALDRAGKSPTVDSFIKALESITGYRDMFGGPTLNFSATNHQGAKDSYLNMVQNGRWVPITKEAISYAK